MAICSCFSATRTPAPTKDHTTRVSGASVVSTASGTAGGVEPCNTGDYSWTSSSSMTLMAAC